jgi:hypothetical protein
MRYNFLTAFGIGVVILLIGSTPSVFAQNNVSNQTIGQANSSDALKNSTVFSIDNVGNMSNITTPEGDANTYR